MNSKYGSRKFIAALASLAGAQWGLMAGLLPAAEYRLVVLGTIGAYILGNVIQRGIDRPKEPTP